MEYTHLGRSGLSVSRLCLGTMNFGWKTDEGDAHDIAVNTAVSSNPALLAGLKDELFALESERLNGTISPEEYAQAKAGLEAMLKRALKKS